jgi:hypothetical protein
LSGNRRILAVGFTFGRSRYQGFPDEQIGVTTLEFLAIEGGIYHSP